MECLEDVCHRPEAMMGLYQSSSFCIMPPGEAAVRRAVFEALIGGCIPVIFDSFSTVQQYTWHLPVENATYAIHIPIEKVKGAKVNVIDKLKAKSPRAIKKMRNSIIYNLMPGLVYNHPRSRATRAKDAFDIAIDNVLHKIRLSRAELRELEGRESAGAGGDGGGSKDASL
eukprot:jgi/Mesen1/2356/ME000156S01500